MTSLDLMVLVPSRGRPQNVKRLVEACTRTCRAGTRLAFGFDDDDPALQASIMAADGAEFSTAPRMGLAKWTNALSDQYLHVPYLASLGDDMVPMTIGWDVMLLDAQHLIGGGFTYPDDRRRHDIPEAVVIDTRIVKGLGWMCEPTISHWYTDNVWRDLGAGAGCLKFVPDALVVHKHPNVKGGDPPDATYSDAAAAYNTDLAAYQRWRLKRMAADTETVRRVREQAQHPV
jgi:hypothetical protein